MDTKATTVAAFIDSLPEERKSAVKKLRQVIKKNLPKGFKETVASGMIHWVVPHSKYPDGYHCDPQQPLPFASLASNKGGVAVYHMGMYADPKLNAWFQKQWPKHVKTKLDMGKSCVRLKKIETIPYDLFGELMGRMSPEQWIECYEKAFRS
jgi:hypothetical protein